MKTRRRERNKRILGRRFTGKARAGENLPLFFDCLQRDFSQNLLFG
jgi:hypothetical protein